VYVPSTSSSSSSLPVRYFKVVGLTWKRDFLYLPRIPIRRRRRRRWKGNNPPLHLVFQIWRGDELT
jgi:hypothetical protein